jgi:hypothetical protein
MYGASISRWTMAYFAASLVFLFAGLALLGSGFGLPSVAPDAPDTLVVVHLITIGWLGLLFCGALLQFVPVLAATHLQFPWLAAPALLSLALGLALLVVGFLALGGHIEVDPAVMSAGGGLLALGFSCLGVSLAATVLSQKAFGIPGVLVLAGLSALAVTALTGNLFAGLLSGILDAPALAAALPDLIAYHAATGALGWMTITAIGVSYRLFAMFMLAPEGKDTNRTVVVMALSALGGLYLSFALGLFGSGKPGVVDGFAIVAAVALLGYYVNDVWHMFRTRRRKALELNSSAALVALGFLGLGIALLAGSVFLDIALPLEVAAFYILGMGWLTGLGLAQLYKIVPFLTWLEAYGPVMGRVQVPRVQDLVDERHARLWFGVFFLSVVAGAAAIVTDADLLLRAASWCQCAAVAALALEFLRARRLAYAPDPLRLPPGVTRPHLIYAITDPKE